MREQTRMFELETETAELKQRVQELGDQLNSAMCQVEKLARENGKLEAQAMAMQVTLIGVERSIDESVSGIKKHTITYWLDLMGKIAKATDEFKAGHELVQKIHQLEKVVEAARDLLELGLLPNDYEQVCSRCASVNDCRYRSCPIDDLTKSLAELKKVRGE